MTGDTTDLRIERQLATGRRFMVAAKHPWASQAGLDVLGHGGNAVDAAVTCAFAVGVVEPWMSGLGGGGFMTVQPAGGAPVVIDYFARAPRAARPDLYPLVDQIGSDGVGYTGVEGNANADGVRAVAVPGMVAGLALALERFGTIDLDQALAPAIAFATKGFEVGWYQSLLIAADARRLREDPRSRAHLPGRRRAADGTLRRRGSAPAPAGACRNAPAHRRAGSVRLLSRRSRATHRVARPLRGRHPRVGRPGGLSGPRGRPAADPLPGRAAGTAAEWRRRYHPGRGAADPRRVRPGGDWLQHRGLAAPARRGQRPRLCRSTGLRGRPGLLRYRLGPVGVGRLRGRAACGDRSDSRLGARGRGGAIGNRRSGSGSIGGDRERGLHDLPVGGGWRRHHGLDHADADAALRCGRGGTRHRCRAERHDEPVRPTAGRGQPILAVGAPGGRRIMDTCLQMVTDTVDYRLDIQSACAAPLIDCSGRELIADDRLPAGTRERLRAMGHPVRDVSVSFWPQHFGLPTGVAVDPATGLRLGGAVPFGMGVALGR